MCGFQLLLMFILLFNSIYYNEMGKTAWKIKAIKSKMATRMVSKRDSKVPILGRPHDKSKKGGEF